MVESEQNMIFFYTLNLVSNYNIHPFIRLGLVSTMDMFSITLIELL